MRSPTFLELIGGLVNRFKGPNYTRVYQGNKETEFHYLRSKLFGEDFCVTITSRRIIYYTVYRRWWIKNRFKTIYVVVGSAKPEVMEQLGPCLFQSKVYPLLCSKFLAWSTYAHIYAIDAFLENALRTDELKNIDEIKHTFC